MLTRLVGGGKPLAAAIILRENRGSTSEEDGMSDDRSPCTSCGACCATFRVAFRAHELDRSDNGWVPTALTDPLGGDRHCMRGTTSPPRRCLALQGKIGVAVCCAIYDQRPSACRDFAPEAAFGRGQACCGDARRLHGLPPLGGSYEAAVLG